MGFTDDIKNGFEEAVGKAKEFIGEKTNNESLEFDGKKEQAEAGVKDKVSDVKDGAKEAANKVEEAVTGDDE